MDLFQNRNLKDTSNLPPLEIIETVDEEFRYFELIEQSKQRLRAEFGSGARADRVRVPYHVDSEFRNLYGDVYPFVFEWATAKSRLDLSKLGGIRILQNGKPVWEWIPQNVPQ